MRCYIFNVKKDFKEGLVFRYVLLINFVAFKNLKIQACLIQDTYSLQEV